MIERRIVQLKVQTRKQRDRWTHIRTHTGSYTRSHARTLGRKHARYRRTKKQSFESMSTNEQHDHFHFFCLQETLNSLARLSIDALARLGGYLSK